MDQTEQNWKIFLIAAAMGAFALALNDVGDDLSGPPSEPSVVEQQMKSSAAEPPAPQVPENRKPDSHVEPTPIL